ncbi:MAG: putative toxin-antitoxin system toxin component, PIN family [Candidatus Marinimicrobia bacterium]|nr:putative toxin-antitoxin system toxin component, PIN family [Candidatus Neomarinimicrobiota bacterium]
MRIVIDTNVVISGVLFGGNPRKVLDYWKMNSYELICSPEIIDEYEDVLYRMLNKVKNSNSELVEAFLSLLVKSATLIHPHHNTKLSRDPDDDVFVNCALSGRALYIVSGDRDLLDIEEVDGIDIITVREFIEILEK